MRQVFSFRCLVEKLVKNYYEAVTGGDYYHEAIVVSLSLVGHYGCPCLCCW